MIDIKGMKNSEWKILREDLESKLKEVDWRFSRIVRTDKTEIAIEGGSIPIYYNLETNESAVWNKCSRYSRGFVPIEKLMKVKEVLETWGAEICKN